MITVETRQLHKIYRVSQQEVHALRGVDFRAEAGDFVVINGPSGSGKTTFLNLIGCIDDPTSGEVLIEGQIIPENKTLITITDVEKTELADELFDPDALGG